MHNFQWESVWTELTSLVLFWTKLSELSTVSQLYQKIRCRFLGVKKFLKLRNPLLTACIRVRYPTLQLTKNEDFMLLPRSPNLWRKRRVFHGDGCPHLEMVISDWWNKSPALINHLCIIITGVFWNKLEPNFFAEWNLFGTVIAKLNLISLWPKFFI